MGCTEFSGVYRPRRPRESPLWRLTEEHLETFKQVYDDRFAQSYGFWRAEIERTLLAFLDCGDFERGFARVRCDDCRREFFVALSCKLRGFCPSCSAKRAVVWAEWLTEEVLEPVDHVHWVFTVPKRLRLFFLYDRKLLGDLARCAFQTVRDLYCAGLADRHAAPGMVAAIQTWGDLANWQPHIHALATAGVVDRQGRFTSIDSPPSAVAEQMFRRRVIKRLMDQGKLDEDVAAGLLAWRHSGFSVHNKIRADASDDAGLERLCRYLVHPPIAQQRLRFSGANAPCSYRGRRVHPQTGQDRIELDPLEMLARLGQHIPPPGFHMTRLYGAYSNRTRAARARVPAQGEGREPDDRDADALSLTPFQRERRRQWARLIAKVCEVDPLRCPCGATMRVVAVILEPLVIRKILDHAARPEARAHAPPSAG